ncbi:MAG: 16S rRNA (adenine(1518)-N(6)/adenine(1519)-N(6))-dimethyltransferase RsmA [Candidatus Aminicenantales bacterium]
MRKAKALGQHFLTSRSILRKIVDTIAPEKDELVIEIGGGKGSLTFPLADRAGKVIAIEKDKTLIPFLLKGNRDNLVVLQQDILRLDLRKLVAEEPAFRRRVKLAGNLPYSISSPLLFKVLENKDLFSACAFLLQKEVAERISARPGSKKYAPLSILFQMHFDVRLCFTLAPGAFSPPPQVQSALVSLTRRPRPLFPVADEDRFRRFLRAAFAQRRKTLLNNLRSARYPLGLLQESFRHLSLEETVRAEQLSIGQFAGLFDRLTRS